MYHEFHSRLTDSGQCERKFRARTVQEHKMKLSREAKRAENPQFKPYVLFRYYRYYSVIPVVIPSKLKISFQARKLPVTFHQ